MLFTLIAIFVVDKLGRKPLMLMGSAGMGISLVLLGWLLRHATSRWPVGVAVPLGYVATFAMSMGPVVWVMMAEIFPPKSAAGPCRSPPSACGPPAIPFRKPSPGCSRHLDGPITFWFYAGICLVAIAFVALFVPETKGKTLEEIERGWLS